MSIPVTEEVARIAKTYKELQQSPVAIERSTSDALEAMDHRDLARLAFFALEALEDTDTMFGYSMAMLESHVEGSDDCQCAWIVSQSQPGGGFNKFCKTVGGYAPENGPSGDALVFTTWKDAKAALDHMAADIRENFRIYPVVVIVGKEPRTTCPRGELL